MKSEIGDDKNPENKDLEEGEISVSDEEEKIEEVDDENAKWINRLSGSLRPVTRKRVLLETPGGVDESHTYEGKPKKPRYFDYDQMQGEDDWSSNTMPSAKGKRGRSGRENFIWAVPTSKKTDSSTTSEGTPNGFSLPRERSCIDMAAAKTMRLGALCHIKPKTKKRKSHGKRRKMKPRVKDSPVCEDRPPCKYFLEGHCAKGAECPFYHPFEDKSFMKIKKLCKFYSGGNCRRGKDCNFMHDEFPCKFYHTGAICYSNENCRFSHKPLTEEMKKMLNDFLNGSSSDDNTDEDTSPERSKSKQPVVKRPCILGSPPKHIKESQETKEWQAEMRRLRHSSERHSAAFKIKITRVKEVSSPGKPSRLNFYTDTLLHASGSANESSPLSKVLPSASLPLCNVPNQNSPGSVSEESGKCQASGSSMADKLPPLITVASASRKKSVKQENEKSESPNSRSFGSISKALGLPDITLPPIRVPNYTPREPLKSSDPVLHYQKKTSSERDVDTENASIKQEFPKAKVDEVHESFYYNSEEDDDDFYCSEDDYDGSTEVEDDILIDDLEMQDREPCPEIAADSMLNNGLRVKSARQKVSADVKCNTDEETDAYWEDIQCNPAALSPVTENHSSSPVDTVPPLLEDFRLHNLTRASDLPLDLRVKCHDSRKTDFPTDPRLKNKQQKRPAGDIFSSPPLLTEPWTANQPPSRDDTLLLKPNPVIVSEGLHDFGSVLSKHSGDTTYPHNFMSVYGMKGRPSLHKHLAQGTDVCISDWTSTSITQPSVLTALSLNLVKCDTVNYLTNGNSPQKKATPLTLESSAPEGLKTSLQKCVHPCLHQTAGGSHDVPVDSSPVPVLKSPSTVSQSYPHVPVHRSHLPGSLGGVWFEKLHCPHLFLKKGSMAEKKSQRTEESC